MSISDEETASADRATGGSGTVTMESVVAEAVLEGLESPAEL
jgi:hypothetical protein